MKELKDIIANERTLITTMISYMLLALTFKRTPKPQKSTDITCDNCILQIYMSERDVVDSETRHQFVIYGKEQRHSKAFVTCNTRDDESLSCMSITINSNKKQYQYYSPSADDEFFVNERVMRIHSSIIDAHDTNNPMESIFNILMHYDIPKDLIPEVIDVLKIMTFIKDTVYNVKKLSA